MHVCLVYTLSSLIHIFLKERIFHFPSECELLCNISVILVEQVEI